MQKKKKKMTWIEVELKIEVLIWIYGGKILVKLRMKKKKILITYYNFSTQNAKILPLNV